MTDNISTSCFRADPLGRHTASGTLFSFVLFLLLLGLCTPQTTHAAIQTGVLAYTAPSGVPFAFADFDGDHRPDVATVEATPGRTPSTENYWVRLRLSSTGKKFIRLSAPKGGLLVEARDVNGDNAVDLILATPWLGQPVRILLNDGRGNFSPADPASFPEASRKSSADWNGLACSRFYPDALSRDSFPLENLLAPFGELPIVNKDLLQFQIARSVTATPAATRAGRAPPSSTVL